MPLGDVFQPVEIFTIRPAAGWEAIQAFESKYGVVLSADIREYFLKVDAILSPYL